jgi:hypothetical protein
MRGVKRMKNNQYKIHPSANLVPMATELELQALIQDIQENGQREDALLYKGEIVDGRNRQIACQKLGIDLKVREIDETMKQLDVVKLVKSMSTRRNLSNTQLAMSAVNEINLTKDMHSADQKVIKLTSETAAKKWAVSKRLVERAMYIYKQDLNMAETLFNGGTVQVYDSTKKLEITTNKLSTIETLLKKNVLDQEEATLKVLFECTDQIHQKEEEKKYEIDFNDYLPNPTVQQHFWDNYKSIQEVSVLKRDIAILLTKLADKEAELNGLQQKRKRTLFTVSTLDLSEDDVA